MISRDLLIQSYCISGVAKLEMKSKSGAIPYMESVIQGSPTGRALRMCYEDKNICSMLFNSAKQERSFSSLLFQL